MILPPPPSAATAGGTPGEINSVFGQKLDEVSPRVDSVVTVDSRTIRLYFNEPMDTASLYAGIYTIQGFDGRPLATIAGDTAVTLTYEQPFANGVDVHVVDGNGQPRNETTA